MLRSGVQQKKKGQSDNAISAFSKKLDRLDANFFEKSDADACEALAENSRSYLPMEEYLEFLKDIRDVMNLYKSTLFTKVTEHFLSLKSNTMSNEA